MDLNPYFKSIVDMDNCSVVICDINHIIIYMNPAAVKSFEKYGGAALIGKSVLGCHNEHSRMAIKRVVEWFAKSKDHNRVHTFFREQQNKDAYMIALRDSDDKLIGYYEKHEFRNRDESKFYDLYED